MGYTIVKCPHCGHTVDHGFSGSMQDKHAVRIDKNVISHSCSNCGKSLIVQGEWSSFSLSTKIIYFARTSLFLLFGAFILWSFKDTLLFKKSDDVAMLFILVLFGVCPFIYGLMNLYKIFSSTNRTR